MDEIKKQRYVVKASQGDVHYHFPYTTDEKLIEVNKDKAWRNCFIADYGRISGVIIQDPTGYSVEGFMIYEGDTIIFEKGDVQKVCEIIKKDNLFYGVYTNEEETKEYLLMNDGYTYTFQEPEFSETDEYEEEDW